jgi:hypothetical protein
MVAVMFQTKHIVGAFNQEPDTIALGIKGLWFIYCILYSAARFRLLVEALARSGSGIQNVLEVFPQT